MIKFFQIQNDFESMKEDLKRFHCSVTVVGGMKERGYSNHDVDIIITMKNEATEKELKEILKKWDKIFHNKYGLWLDAKINKDKKHIYDYGAKARISKGEMIISRTLTKTEDSV